MCEGCGTNDETSVRHTAYVNFRRAERSYLEDGRAEYRAFVANDQMRTQKLQTAYEEWQTARDANPLP